MEAYSPHHGAGQLCPLLRRPVLQRNSTRQGRRLLHHVDHLQVLTWKSPIRIRRRRNGYEISPCFSAASDSQSTGGRIVARVPKGVSMKWGKPEWAAIPLRLMLGII